MCGRRAAATRGLPVPRAAAKGGSGAGSAGGGKDGGALALATSLERKVWRLTHVPIPSYVTIRHYTLVRNRFRTLSRPCLPILASVVSLLPLTGTQLTPSWLLTPLTPIPTSSFHSRARECNDMPCVCFHSSGPDSYSPYDYHP